MEANPKGYDLRQAVSVRAEKAAHQIAKHLGLPIPSTDVSKLRDIIIERFSNDPFDRIAKKDPRSLWADWFIRAVDGGTVLDWQVSRDMEANPEAFAKCLAHIIADCWEHAAEHDREREHPNDPAMTAMIRKRWESESDGEGCCPGCGGIDFGTDDTCERCGLDRPGGQG